LPRRGSPGKHPLPRATRPSRRRTKCWRRRSAPRQRSRATAGRLPSSSRRRGRRPPLVSSELCLRCAVSSKLGRCRSAAHRSWPATPAPAPAPIPVWGVPRSGRDCRSLPGPSRSLSSMPPAAFHSPQTRFPACSRPRAVGRQGRPRPTQARRRRPAGRRLPCMQRRTPAGFSWQALPFPRLSGFHLTHPRLPSTEPAESPLPRVDS
jgi:hypothetical protein